MLIGEIQIGAQRIQPLTARESPEREGILRRCGRLPVIDRLRGREDRDPTSQMQRRIEKLCKIERAILHRIAQVLIGQERVDDMPYERPAKVPQMLALRPEAN